MKKCKSIMCLLMAGMMLLGGCVPGADLGKTTTQKTALAVPRMPSGEAFLEERNIDEDFLRSVMDFCTDSSAVAAGQNPEKNLAFSPVSLYMALAMTSTGAEGETLEEILKAFHMEGLDKDKLAEQSKELFKSIYFDSQSGKTYMANSIWVDDEIMEVKESFYNRTADSFFAPSYHSDLQSTQTQQAISDWVSEQTNGKVTREIPDPINEDWRMSLINAIYFIDQWGSQFDPELTETQSFTLADGSKVDADFMKQTFSNAWYKKTDDFESITLWFQTGYKMTFYLPSAERTASELLTEKLIPSKEENLLGSYEVNLSLPKFDIKNQMDLLDMLKELGITSAIDSSKADFSGISGKDSLFIGNAIQAAAVTVDEEGCEAAAYTEISMATTGIMEEMEEVTLTFDRSFVFSLTNKEGVPLFTGVVNNPAEK